VKTTESIKAIDDATEEQSRAARRVAELIQELAGVSGAGRPRQSVGVEA
jgi:methyl-accepting chemotaxis protein